MAHRILVLSPLHNLGSSVCSALLAQGSTYGGRSSALVFTDQMSPLPRYLGLEETVQDPTRNVTQIMELIDAAAIANSDILNYAHIYSKNAYLVNTADASLNEKVLGQTVEYIFDRITTDVVVCDCSDAFDTAMTKRLVDLAHMVFIVTDMSEKCIRHLSYWLKQQPLVDCPNVFVIVNRYDEAISSLRDFAKKIGLPASRVCKYHYNPWIGKCCLNKQLHTILPLSMSLDYRVAALKNDVDEMNQAISSDMLIKAKKGF